jgi:DNA-binding SARP family transcriptional activator
MSTLRISLFGRFHAERNAEALTGLSTGKVQELLCYLLLYRSRLQSRELLAALFWGDYSTERAKKYLRQALWQLQAALGADSDALHVEPQWVGVKPVMWLDVEAFEQAYALVEATPGQSLDGERLRQVERAVELFGDGLLHGYYQDWCLLERDRLQTIYIALLYKLMDYCEAHGDYQSAIVHGRRILRFDRACERTHQRLMYLHYLSGDRTAALRQYDRCVAALHEELSVTAAHSTVELCERIRVDDLAVRPFAEMIGTLKMSSLPEMLDQVRQLQTLLDSFQTQIERAMDAQAAQ